MALWPRQAGSFGGALAVCRAWARGLHAGPIFLTGWKQLALSAACLPPPVQARARVW